MGTEADVAQCMLGMGLELPMISWNSFIESALRPCRQPGPHPGCHLTYRLARHNSQCRIKS